MATPKTDKFLLDSDIAIWMLRGKIQVADSVVKIVSRKTACISLLTVSEIYKGSKEGEENSYLDFFSFHAIMPIDFTIAKTAGEYWKKYRHINTNLIDFLIAATCKERKLTLLTGNTKHFPMADIKIIDPLAK